MRLYFLGNGFDLSHNLDTSYLNFKHYLRDNYSSLYLKFIKMYEIYGDDADMFWSDFENNLACLSNYYLFDMVNSNNCDFNIGKPYDTAWKRDVLISNLDVYSELQQAFISWAGEKDRDTIKVKYKISKLFFSYDRKCVDGEEGSDFFLVFNYTHTLERVYGINKEYVFRPHGEVGKNCLEPQFGHGNDDCISKVNNLYNETADMYERVAYNWAEEYLRLTRKNVNEFLSDVDIFYDSHNLNPDTICVIGMSFGKADIPYFRQAHNNFSRAKWIISYHKDEDGNDQRKYFIRVLKEIGILSSNIRFIEL
ncbi:AbiH family protein [Anaerolentibacter hominis]|uniref:AbiH family protein n=1 Tax=Anaerolentibacter hominis TaxID=3079009 RepID=UPI0031B8862C